jgi:hypothetical protein
MHCCGSILLGVIQPVAKVASVHCTCCVDPLKQRSLNAHRHMLVVSSLYLLIEREWHPLTVVVVTANATKRDHPPLRLTVRCQHVAGGMVPPTAKGRPIAQAMDLTNLCVLLHELQPPMLLAILAQGDLVLVDMEGYVLCGSVLSPLLLWNRLLLAVTALERLALPVQHSMQTLMRTGALHDSQQRF